MGTRREPLEADIECILVDAGDGCTAGMVSALCAGASPTEAAVAGNCAASITVQQIGTTATASTEQVARRFANNADLFAGIE